MDRLLLQLHERDPEVTDPVVELAGQYLIEDRVEPTRRVRLRRDGHLLAELVQEVRKEVGHDGLLGLVLIAAQRLALAEPVGDGLDRLLRSA